MPTDLLILNCIIIFAARIVDVALGTLRTLFIVRGSRFVSWILGFFEVFIWIWVVSGVIDGVKEQPIYSIFYAVGFATGSVVGLTIERWLAVGDKTLLLFTRKAKEVADALRASGYVLTELKGEGHDGPISVLILKVARKELTQVSSRVRAVDPECYVIVESVDTAFSVRPTLVPRTGWRTPGRKWK